MITMPRIRIRMRFGTRITMLQNTPAVIMMKTTTTLRAMMTTNFSLRYENHQGAKTRCRNNEMFRLIIVTPTIANDRLLLK
jgi:hypothetical protein